MKSLSSKLWAFLLIGFAHFIIRPVKAVLVGWGACMNYLGTPGGVLSNIWTSNQNASAPTSSGTQTVAITATAALNKQTGTITITGLTAAAGANQLATITNTEHTATSYPVFSPVKTYTGTWGTNGIPCLVQVNTATAGTWIFRIMNLDGANALAGNITISFAMFETIL